MDESRKDFEQWALEVMQFTPDDLRWDEIYACAECVNEWLVYRDPNGDMSNEEGKAAL